MKIGLDVRSIVLLQILIIRNIFWSVHSSPDHIWTKLGPKLLRKKCFVKRHTR